MSLPRYKMITVFVMLLIVGMTSEGTTGELGLTSSLKGLKGMTVGVSLQGFTEPGITMDDVKVTAEVELRKAGIKVYNLSVPSDAKEWRMEGEPHLAVRFMKVKTRTQSAVTLAIALMQNASLSRDGTKVGAITWIEDSGYINHNADDLLNDLRKTINYFINDYLAVNPK